MCRCSGCCRVPRVKTERKEREKKNKRSERKCWYRFAVLALCVLFCAAWLPYRHGLGSANMRRCVRKRKSRIMSSRGLFCFPFPIPVQLEQQRPLSLIQKHQLGYSRCCSSPIFSQCSAGAGQLSPSSLCLFTPIDLTTLERLPDVVYFTTHVYFPLRGSGSTCNHRLDCRLFGWAVYAGLFEHN
jgi:hypothetical protein